MSQPDEKKGKKLLTWLGHAVRLVGVVVTLYWLDILEVEIRLSILRPGKWHSPEQALGMLCMILFGMAGGIQYLRLKSSGLFLLLPMAFLQFCALLFLHVSSAKNAGLLQSLQALFSGVVLLYAVAAAVGLLYWLTRALLLAQERRLQDTTASS